MVLCVNHKYDKYVFARDKMTSNIKPDAININFPVANTDNSSQGFRDNFEQIKANLQIAAAEITKLQNTTIKLRGVV